MSEMERLFNADGAELVDEVDRARAMVNVATAINNNTMTVIRVRQYCESVGEEGKIALPGADQ